MKVNKKALELVDLGLKPDTVAKLSESQINVLHKKMIGEEIRQNVTNITFDPKSANDQKLLAQKGIHVDPATNKLTMSTTATGEITKEEEVTEDQDVSMTSATSGEISQQPHQVQNDDGTGDDTDPKSPAHDMEGTVESEIKEDKKSKKNPWAICTAQMGKEFGTTERSDWSKPQTKKYERCVKDVKKSLKEGKEPLSLYLENQIMSIVEKHIPPRMTKGDLLKYLNEDGPAVAPSKPKEKPTTKPGKPGTKPQKPGHPLKNPNPGEKPAPKAKKEEAKKEVIDLIVSLLKK
jgi:hypothetical protein